MIRLIYKLKRGVRRLSLIVIALCIPFLGCEAGSAPKPHVGYRIIDVAPHDPTMFTQGFEIADGFFYESAGLYGKSRIQRYLPDSTIDAQWHLPDNEFAEGLSVSDQYVVLLTWQNRKLYFLDKTTLQPSSSTTIAGEGWGAAFVDGKLAISNGSDAVTFYSLAPFEKLSKIQVTGFNRPWQKINELEYAKGLLWANIWQENIIIAIDPSSGNVVYQFDLSAIVKQSTEAPARETLNGIAYDPLTGAFWLTGKLWSKRYLVEFDLNQ